MRRQWFDIGKSSRLVRGFGLAALMSSILLGTLTPVTAETWTGRKDGCGEPGASPCGDNGTWGDKYNWDSETVPGSDADVTITGGDISSGARIVKSLSVTGGAVGFDSLVVKETLQLSAGVVGVNTTLQIGILTMSGGDINAPVGLLKGDREQDRVFNWTGGILNSPNFTIPVDGKLIISGTSPKHSSGIIINRGTVTASGRGVSDGGFDNYGTVTVSGNFIFNQDSASGNHHAFNNFGTFIKNGGATTDMGLFQLNNTGTVRVESGTLVTTDGGTSNGSWTVLPSAVLDLTNVNRLDGGAHFFQSGTTLMGGGLVRLTSGLVYCADDVTFGTTASPTTFLLNGGILTTQFPQKFTLASGSTMNWTSGTLQGILDVAQGATLNINGALDKTFTAIINNAGLTNWSGPGKIVSTGSEFNNQATGQWRLLSDGDVFGDGGPVPGTLTNAGTLSKYAGAGTTSFAMAINNTGILEAKSGILLLSNELTLNTGSRFIGAGTHRLVGGIIAGNTTVEGTMELLSGTLASSTDTQKFTVASGANFNWKGGRLQSGGSQAPNAFTIAQGGNLNISGPALKEFDRITNAGTTTLDGGGDLTGYAGLFTNTGTFNALNGATFIAGAYNNAGRSYFLNEGTLNIGAPGTVGTFNFSLSDYTQSATGRLNVDISSASSFDKLILSGTGGDSGSTATLSGKVNVNLLNGFIPPPDSLYRVMSFLTPQGEFSQIVDGNPADDRGFTALYNPSNFTLKVLDESPQITIDDVAVLEGNSVNFTVTLSKASTQDVTVKYATANGSATATSDYTTKTGTLTIPAGQTKGTINVVTTGDTLDEIDETFFVNLSAPTSAVITDTQGRCVIIDNDAAPSVSINDVTVTEGDVDKNATFTITLSAASGQVISINAIPFNGSARSPFDYVSGGIRLIFAEGETSKTFSVPIKGDLLDEPDETFFVILTSPVNCSVGRGRSVGTILDNDAGPSITIDDVRIGEGNAGQRVAAFRLKLSSPSGRVVRVNYSTVGNTATAGEDFVAVAPTQIAFTTGNIYAYARVLINGDTLNEPDETFFVNLSAPIGATIADAQALGTILNDDPTPALTINDVSIAEGNSGSKNLTFTVTLSAPSSNIISVNYATANGTARSDSDYAATNGNLVFARGTTTRTITVVIKGETVVEGDEMLFILLSGAVNANVSKARGVGTITNDDASG